MDVNLISVLLLLGVFVPVLYADPDSCENAKHLSTLPANTTLTQRWSNAGPSSVMLAQYQTSTGSTPVFAVLRSTQFDDPHIYMFGYGNNFGAYEYINKDGELMGLGYDLARSVCRVMNKKCEHSVYYNYKKALDNTGMSLALNNEWYDVIASWLVTKSRKASYSFFGEYAAEPATYMYVRRGRSMDTVSEIKDQAKSFGFHTGFASSDTCLEKYLDLSLDGKKYYYDTPEDLQNALEDGEVDVIFMGEISMTNDHEVSRVGNEPIKCAIGGLSYMTTKQKMKTLKWFDEGLQMLKDNGDYAWLCELNDKDHDPACFL